MRLNSYYICDENGYVESKIQARTLIHEMQADGVPVWTLKNLYGQPEHLKEEKHQKFCHEDCWVDPDAEFSDKVKKGCEEEFDFFMEHGYHMPRKVENAND
jgi:hypothetical protein